MNAPLSKSLNSIYLFCGSIRFAMLLLGVIIVASIFGTLVESGFNAAVAQAYIYDAPWFIAWLLLLCVNLTVAVMVRYPWKPHQWGFVITHAGIVVILVGGIIGRIWGVEGNVTLHAGGSPQNFLVVNETFLQVHRAEKISSFPLKLNLRRPEPDTPLHFRAGDLKVNVLQLADELGIRQVVEPAASSGAPALRLVMRGDAAPHPIDQWMVRDNPLRNQIALGRNVVRFPGEDRAEVGPHGKADTGLHDCCPTDTGPVSVESYASLPRPGEPESASEEDCCATDTTPGIGSGDGGLHYHPPHQHVLAGDENQPPKGNQLQFRYTDGRLAYESRTADGTFTGIVELGAEFSAGWPGWSFQVKEIMDRAVVREEIAPLELAGMRSIGSSGLLVELEKNGHTARRWLEMGKMSFFFLEGEAVHMGFGFRLHPLDFQVELERFEVEFNAGTQTPASFKSHVVFTNPSGEKFSRAVWMNNPTNFPSFPGVGLLGTSYKFSQSSWNPGDHDQTTLQVIRDPGWSLKWIGSLLFCLGMIMIFYLKPYPRFIRTDPEAVAEEISTIGKAPEDVTRPQVRQPRKELVSHS